VLRIGLRALVGVLLALVVLEFSLRRFGQHFLGAPVSTHGMYATDSGETYWLVPGWRGEQWVEGRPIAIQINSLGMRRSEIDASLAGAPRVLCLGDSFVYGQGAAQDETISARLEARLGDALGRPVAVGNGGVPGHGTRDLAPMLERFSAFQPDCIVAFTYLGNDFVEDCRLHSGVIEGYLVDGPVARVARENLRFRLTMRFRTLYAIEKLLQKHLPELAFDVYRLAPTAAELEAKEHFPPPPRDFAGLFFDRVDEDELVRKVEARCRANFERLMARAGGTPVLLVVLPSWWHVDADRWRTALEERGLDPERHRRGLAQQRLLAIAADLGLPALDLSPGLEAAPDGASLWLPVDRHLSPAGYDRVAEWLVPEVSRRLTP
jgi:lysophospholipase L1-like esterase